MSNVRSLSSNNNLANIPHMLRNLAAEFESGVEPMPRTLFVIAVGDGSKPPDLFQFGAELSRLEEAGAMYACANLALQVETP